MFKYYLNRGLSTPVAIGIILILAIFIGIFTYWQYTEIQKKQTQIQEMKVPEKEGEISFKEAVKECESFFGSLSAIEELEGEGKEYLEDYLNSVCIKPLCDSFKTTEEKIQACAKETDIYERDKCFLGIEACDNISDSTYTSYSSKTSCYQYVAKKNGDDSACDKINDDIGQRVECYKTIANIKKDSKICQKIDYNYFKNWCLENSKTHLCKYQMEDFGEGWLKKDKDYCLGVTTGDISKCGDEENSEKYDCYSEVAKSKNDLSICEKIVAPSDSYDYGLRKDYCILGVAEIRKDDSLCETIEDKEYKSSCYLSIVDKIDVDFCYKKSLSMDSCYTKLALQEKDISLCYKVISHPEVCSFAFISLMQSQFVKLNKNLDEEDQSLYDRYCKAEFKSQATKKSEIIDKAKEILEKKGNIDEAIVECKKLEMFWEYSECVANLAIIKNNSSICKDFVIVEEGETGYSRYLCYERFAVETNNISVCALAEISSFNDKCYTILAVKNNDKSICNLIKPREDNIGTMYSKDMCPNWVENATVDELLNEY